ncbi:hypothetical protein [Glutamicibacter nicotianae]|uniref:hypothetical protein n=1 Tax=Glutamicibacter nicotianae TaxID=37929 RepID=UPI0037BF8792
MPGSLVSSASSFAAASSLPSYQLQIQQLDQHGLQGIAQHSGATKPFSAFSRSVFFAGVFFELANASPYVVMDAWGKTFSVSRF